ncbi:Striatin family-domain-containing protein [Scheffersomyces xylosifermentans]|uniref:Striatin family-domain-containing protein n=1 Tax=Scheffersomyces xylosifermentans TaxID=1304137 RepID=UPI00315D9E5E
MNNRSQPPKMGSNGTQNQWQQQQGQSSQQSHQNSQQQSQPIQSQQSLQLNTSAYTLPGVINYLTSEFTNLERFKIMTNLEKSEMKYKIVQLQGELNSLKFINGKQKSRIEALEAENRKLRLQQSGKDKHEHVSSSSSSIYENDEEKGTGGDGSIHNDKEKIPEDIYDMEIPEIDLSVIKKSRQQLTKSMKEIVQLLKTPSVKSVNYLDLPDPHNAASQNEFDVLFDHSPEFFEREEALLTNHHKAHFKDNSIISPYFSDKEGEKERPQRKTPRTITIGNDNTGRHGHSDAFGADSEPHPEPDLFSNLDKKTSDLKFHLDGDDDEKFNVRFLEPPSETIPIPMDDHGDETNHEEEDLGNESRRTDNYNANRDYLVDESDTETVVFDENLDIHYAPVKRSSLDPASLPSDSYAEEFPERDGAKHTKENPSKSEEQIAIRQHKEFDYENFHITIEPVGEHTYNVTVSTKSDNTVIFGEPVSLSVPFDKIADFYPIYLKDSAISVAAFIVVETDTSIRSIIIDSSEPEKLEFNLRTSFVDTSATGFIEFAHKSTDTSTSYGLAISGTSQSGQFVSRVFQITYDVNKGITTKEIGNYNKAFLTKNKVNETIQFVGWFTSDKLSTSPKAIQSPKSKSKHDKKALFCDDVSLAPYELLYKVGDKYLELNIVSKKVNYTTGNEP